MLGRSAIGVDSSPLRSLERGSAKASAKTKMKAIAIGRIRDSFIGLAVKGHVLESKDDASLTVF